MPVSSAAALKTGRPQRNEEARQARPPRVGSRFGASWRRLALEQDVVGGLALGLLGPRGGVGARLADELIKQTLIRLRCFAGPLRQQQR